MTIHYQGHGVTLHHGDCLDVLRTLPDASVDSVVTDPPYGLGFMGREWDALPPGREWAEECLRVLKPGGHLLAFGGTRTWHRLACAVEDAGFEVRDSIAWLYGCLSDDTEILTSEGWVRYDRATEGQHALAFDTATGALAWQAIQHVHRYPYAGEMVRLHSEHTDQLLTPNHRVVLDEGRPTPHTPYVPSEQDLRRLLADVPGARPLPVGAEADVLAGVRGSADLAAEEGQGQASLGAGGPYGAVRDVRDGDVEAGCLAQADRGGVLLEPMQRRAPGGGVGEALPQGQGGLDRRQPGVLPGEDDRAEQPRMEGRRYRVQEARELRRSALRASAGMGATDGPQGRVHHGAPATDGRPLRVPADQAGSHQPREPRPQGQPTGEPDPLALEPGAQALRVGEDGGGRLLPSTGVTADVVDYAGVVWCITVPHGAFIARRNGLIFATGNSGFPKSLDVSKSIDKLDAADERRDRALEFTAWMRSTGITSRQIDEATGTNMGGHLLTIESQPCVATAELFDALRPLLPEVPERIERLIADRTVESKNFAARPITGHHDQPAAAQGWRAAYVGGDVVGPQERRDVAHTAAAAAWQGWGTALKPAFEPVVVARKPLIGTVAATVLAHGTGALNIDGCRIGLASGEDVAALNARSGGRRGFASEYVGGTDHPLPPGADLSKGRWPANVVLDESQAAALDEQSGDTTRYFQAPRQGDGKSIDGSVFGQHAGDGIGYNDTGGASRYFYVAKADASERPRVNGTAHPTVKPLALMRWLVRLVTPPGGTVLEPFAGSGTTVEACIIEGFQCIAIEREADYLPLIRQRIDRRRDPVEALRGQAADLGLFDLLGGEGA